MAHSVKVVRKDPNHERWWNACLGLKFLVKERNGTVYEVVQGTHIGSLINKGFCE